MRTFTIFIAWIIGLAFVGNALKGVSAPWSGPFLFASFGSLLLVLNRFGKAKP